MPLRQVGFIVHHPKGCRLTFSSRSHPNSRSSLLIFSPILNCHAKWTLIELARNPEVQDTLRAEFRSALGATDDPADIQRVNTLPYLDAFTSEVLRVHPVVPDLTREVSSRVLHPSTIFSSSMFQGQC